MLVLRIVPSVRVTYSKVLRLLQICEPVGVVLLVSILLRVKVAHIIWVVQVLILRIDELVLLKVHVSVLLHFNCDIYEIALLERSEQVTGLLACGRVSPKLFVELLQ